MELDYLHEFTMVVKHGNLSEAAVELYTTQSALSRHLSALEKEVGSPLFNRSTNPMSLTHVGEVFLKESSPIVNDYLRLMDRMRHVKESDFSVLTLTGMMDKATSALLHKAKVSLQQSDPSIVLKYVPVVYQTSLEMLRQKEADVALEPLSGLIDIHELSSLALIQEKTVIVAEKDHPLAGRASLTSKDIEQERFTSLRSNKDHAIRKHLQDICRRLGWFGDIPKGLSLTNSDSYPELFAFGFEGNLLMLPESMACEYSAFCDDAYVVIPFDEPDSDYSIHAFFAENPSANVRRFISCLEALV